MMTVAERTLQRKAALAKANAVRSGHVLLKKELHDGHILIADAYHLEPIRSELFPKPPSSPYDYGVTA